MIKSRWLSISFLAIAVACLGASLRGRDWLYKEWAIQLLHGATGGLIVAMACSRIRGNHRWQRAFTVIILLLAVAVQFYLLFTERPGSASNVKWSPKGPHVTDLGPDIPRLGEGGILFQSEKRMALTQEQQELHQRIKQLQEESQHTLFPWMKGEYEKEIYTAGYRIGEIDSIFTATRFQTRLLIFGGLALIALFPWRIIRNIVV